MKEFLSRLNLAGQCKSHGLTLWQCPQFLFLVMGFVIILASLLSYLMGTRYISEPSLVALFVLSTSAVLFVISFVITHSFERLAEASRMKSEFVNIVSHQLRGPITNIQWGLDFLTSEKKTMSEEKRDDYFSNLKENVGRMVELVDDLIIVSRLEEGTFPTKKEEIDFEKFVSELIDRFKIFAEASNVDIHFSCQKYLPRVFADPNQIKLVIENLLDNAIRYTKGGGKIEIRCSRQSRRVYCEVKDSGVGIPRDDQKYIFQKFFRSSNAMRKSTHGSGLGLFMTKSIIEKSGGKIWFRSEVGRGTTFYFVLPIK